jgi:hypothetical protein
MRLINFLLGKAIRKTTDVDFFEKSRLFGRRGGLRNKKKVLFNNKCRCLEIWRMFSHKQFVASAMARNEHEVIQLHILLLGINETRA